MIVKRVYRKCKSMFLDIEAYNNFKHYKLCDHNKKINVIFITQYIPAWNKTKPLYNAISKDSRFNVKMLCVPNSIANPSHTNNDVYEYFYSQGYSNIINAVNSQNEWVKLKDLNPDYVFYPRPYNAFMPDLYKTNTVSKYAKIALFLYGIGITSDIEITTHNNDFFRNVYCYFAQSEETQKKVINTYKREHKNKLRYTLNFGNPVLYESYEKYYGKQHDKFTILWTPRWSTDKSLGGSNFFEYKDFFIDFARKHKDIDVICRPHPLMIDNFIKTGEWTESDANKFLNLPNKISNFRIDQDKEYFESFSKASILVSDMSSIIPEFFMSGKPIIFCSNNMTQELNDTGKKVIKCCLTAKNLNNLEKNIDELINGSDVNKEIREKAIKEIISAKTEKSIENNMISFLYEH